MANHAGVGLGTITDAVTAIKHLVYDEGALAMEELLVALGADFDGHERVKQMRQLRRSHGRTDWRWTPQTMSIKSEPDNAKTV